MSLQADLFAEVSPPPRESRINKNGILEAIEIVRTPSVKKQPAPNAEIRLAYWRGQFYWSTDVNLVTEGSSFAPGIKWKGTSAPDRFNAIAAAAESIRRDVSRRNKPDMAKRILSWLDHVGSQPPEPISPDYWRY